MPLSNNQHVLVSDLDDVRLLDVDSFTVTRTFELGGMTPLSIALLPDGLRFISGSWDKTARIAYHGLVPVP